jgi:hypothetical protein
MPTHANDETVMPRADCLKLELACGPRIRAILEKHAAKAGVPYDLFVDQTPETGPHRAAADADVAALLASMPDMFEFDPNDPQRWKFRSRFSDLPEALISRRIPRPLIRHLPL